jgi:methyl-accepting chemotaxis protein
MTEKLSFTKKLILMLLVPITGLLVFSALQTSEKLQVVSSMEALDELTGLAVDASQLAHELQKERGLTAGFLSDSRDASAALQNQRVKVDETASKFRETIQSLALDGDLKRSADRAAQKLAELPNHRSLVSASNTELKEGIAYYTDLIGHLVSVIGSISQRASTPGVALRLVSLDALVRQKELAGQERAMLNAVFTAGTATGHDRRELSINVGKQLAYEEMFFGQASEDARAMYREKLSANHVEEVARLRAAAAGASGPAAPDDAEGASAEAARTLDVSAQDWWRVATARIDSLYAVEEFIQRRVQEDVNDLRSNASWALFFFAGLAVLAVIAATILSYVLARGMIRSFTLASDTLSRIVSQIGGFVQQQSSSTSQTATSVTETTTTVEEIRKTAETADQSSKGMSTIAVQSKNASEEALKAVAHGTEAMQHIRAEVENIAQNILELSEKNIQIGEIVQTVNAIAEQSNLLAVNASIEAAKAGDHGKGFSVVASEVKALAQRSKEATDQIRSILAEIQKSSNAAVMITEQGVKRVEEGAALIEGLGGAIQNLSGAIQQNADSSSQISLIASQQLAGIEQISEAMRNIGVATNQNVEGARQLEDAANEIRSVSTRILEIVQGQQGPQERRAAA